MNDEVAEAIKVARRSHAETVVKVEWAKRLDAGPYYQNIHSQVTLTISGFVYIASDDSMLLAKVKDGSHEKVML